jgi:C1A family cysteine protease
MGFDYNNEIIYQYTLTKKFNNINKINNITSIPKSINWMDLGAVTPIKDQGQCGSCWSFSTTGSLEGAYAIKYGKLVSFSEQQLVDCDTITNGGKGDHGCNGGLMNNAFTFISKYGGLSTEECYPYVSGTTQKAGTCKKTCPLVSGSQVTKYTDVTPNSDTEMMNALSKQPVSVAIEADQKSFQLYSSGIFTGTCGANIDHGVLLYGYGTDSSGVDYYLLKNSWGTSWGESGTMKLGRGNDPTTKNPYNKGMGQCGVLTTGSYPTL